MGTSAKTPSHTHDQLVAMAERWLRRVGCHVTFTELVTMTSSGEIPDAIGWRDSGKISILIECKATRADFLADQNKRFRSKAEAGMGDWRFYLCPPGIINAEELPEGWGLLYARKTRIQRVRGGPSGPLEYWTHPPLKSAKREEVTMLVSALRRLQIRGYLPYIYEGIPGATPPGVPQEASSDGEASTKQQTAPL